MLALEWLFVCLLLVLKIVVRAAYKGIVRCLCALRGVHPVSLVTAHHQQLISFTHSVVSQPLLPSGNHQSVLCTCEFVLALLCLPVLFLDFLEEHL